MLNNLFINASILVSFIFLASQIFKDSPNVLGTTRGKLLAGVLGGLLGVILMYYSIKVHGETLVDFRFIPVVLLSFYGSWISALSAAVLIAMSRVGLYGVNSSSLLGSAAIILIASGCIILLRLKLSHKLKFYIMYTYSLIIVDTTFFVLLRNDSSYYSIILTYSLIYIITGIVVYRLSEYVVQSAKLYLQFKEQARKDFLTGLNNVRQFDTVLNNAYKRVNEFGERLSILTIDIDHFKKVNDTYGHDGGDAVLKQLGEVLQASCRPFDVTARVGGEEFSILLPDCPSSQAVEVAERIRKSVCRHSFLLPSGEAINISISIGAATYPDSTANLEELTKQADIELYKAKESGRNKVCSRFIKEC